MKQFRDVTINKDARTYLEGLSRDSLIIYSPTSMASIGLSNTKVHMIDCRIFGRDVVFMEALCSGGKGYDQVVSVGGGTATDVAKYLAAKMGARFVCVPSMLSTNAFATDKVALVVGEDKVTLDAKLADAIVLDPTLVAKATLQNMYGLADVLSIHTALFDWRLAHETIGENLNREVYRLAEALLTKTTSFILGNTIEAICADTPQLFASIGESGHITNMYGSGRPESGSEHIFARQLEKMIELPHGVSVSVGILLMSLLQGNDSSTVFDCIAKIGTFRELRDYHVNRKLLLATLTSLKPRDDRYSIIDTVSLSQKRCEDLLNRFEFRTGIRLAQR